MKWYEIKYKLVRKIDDMRASLGQLPGFRNLHQALYVRDVKKRIRREEYSDLFTTDQYMGEDYSPSWADFWFIGTHRGRPVVWSACISTTKSDFCEELWDYAFGKAYEKYPDTVPWKERFEKVPGKRYSRMIDPEPELTEKRRVYTNKIMIEALTSGTFFIEEELIEIDETYRWGVGLHVRLNLESITIKDIENFIIAFNTKSTELVDSSKMITYTPKELGITIDGDTIEWTETATPIHSVPLK